MDVFFLSLCAILYIGIAWINSTKKIVWHSISFRADWKVKSIKFVSWLVIPAIVGLYALQPTDVWLILLGWSGMAMGQFLLCLYFKYAVEILKRENRKLPEAVNLEIDRKRRLYHKQNAALLAVSCICVLILLIHFYK